MQRFRNGRKGASLCEKHFSRLHLLHDLHQKFMTENEISKIIVEEALYIHTTLGPGLLESAYVHCLVHRLLKRNLSVRTEVPVPLIFEDTKLDCGYRADIVVENK